MELNPHVYVFDILYRFLFSKLCIIATGCSQKSSGFKKFYERSNLNLIVLLKDGENYLHVFEWESQTQRCDDEGTWGCWDGPAVNGMSLCL